MIAATPPESPTVTRQQPVAGQRERAAKILAWFLSRLSERRQQKESPAVPTGKWLNLRKWLHHLHRDLGFLFFGATIVYAVSGLYLNHRNTWSLAYDHVSRQKLAVPAPGREKIFTTQDATNLLAVAGVNGDYLGHDLSVAGKVKILFQGGNATLDRDTGRVVVETRHPRPMPFILTYIQLHCNPGPWWTWFSDTYCAALVLMAFSGLFLLRGRHGFVGRGGLLVLIGIAVPTILSMWHL
jgi:hypothetical protein